MSLLLDALKKAADKKKESEDGAPEDERLDDALKIEDDVDEVTADDDLDLDLEIDEKEEDFPAVDEEVITESNIEDQPVELDEAEESLLIIDEEDAELEGQQSGKGNALDQEDTNVIDEEIAEPVEEVKEIEQKQEAIVKEKTAPTAEAKSTEPPKDNRSKDEALSALIRKSNYYSENKKMKTRILILVLFLLVLIGGGAYFYIQFTSSTQEVFLADTQSSPKEEAVLRNTSVKQDEPKPVQKSAQIVEPAGKESVVVKPKKIIKKVSKPISFTKKVVEDPIELLIRDAYEAFQSEEYKLSESLYKKVLQREDKNRDALLGLAAIGVKQQRYEYARQKYLSLLKLNPKDSIAHAGLSTIEKKVDPQLSESQLKFMLREQPDAAHLYFALGSLYAKQERWPEAQSAFFSSWSSESNNADYTYNLAVSLDHLGKQDKAKDFYELSIKLHKLKGGNFSLHDAQARVDVLNKK